SSISLIDRLFRVVIRPRSTSTLFPTRRSSDLHATDSGEGLAERVRAYRDRVIEVALRDTDGAALRVRVAAAVFGQATSPFRVQRSEEHTSELQSRENLVCRLLLEKKKKNQSSK